MAVDSIAARAEIAGDSKRNAIGCSADPPGLKPAIRWRLYAGVKTPASFRFFSETERAGVALALFAALLAWSWGGWLCCGDGFVLRFQHPDRFLVAHSGGYGLELG
jgi:hypothetical protein